MLVWCRTRELASDYLISFRNQMNFRAVIEQADRANLFIENTLA